MKLTNSILSSKHSTHWLKSALRGAISRDIVDALNDTELLLNALKERYNATIEKPSEMLKVHSTYDYDKQEWVNPS